MGRIGCTDLMISFLIMIIFFIGEALHFWPCFGAGGVSKRACGMGVQAPWMGLLLGQHGGVPLLAWGCDLPGVASSGCPASRKLAKRLLIGREGGHGGGLACPNVLSPSLGILEAPEATPHPQNSVQEGYVLQSCRADATSSRKPSRLASHSPLSSPVLSSV